MTTYINFQDNYNIIRKFDILIGSINNILCVPMQLQFNYQLFTARSYNYNIKGLSHTTAGCAIRTLQESEIHNNYGLFLF